MEHFNPIAPFENVEGVNLSGRDFSGVSAEVLEKLDFDTTTVWPPAARLPEGFSPERLLESSKNPGLGIRGLHERGITGEGVVAIIDQKLDTTHPEYAGALESYVEYEDVGSEVSMHGSAVASLLVGAACGVAPGARLVYKAITTADERAFPFYAQALRDIVKENESVSEREKVRVVSCSVGYMEESPKPGLDEWIDARQKAKDAGIILVDAHDPMDIPMALGGSPGNREDFDSYVPSLYETDEGREVDRLISVGAIEEALEKLKGLREVSERYSHLVGVSDADLRRGIVAFAGSLGAQIIVPCDYRTMASSYRTPGQYMYNGRGAASWSVPYLAGLVMLALQVNPRLTEGDMSDIITASAVTNGRGLRIVNPEGIVRMAQER